MNQTIEPDFDELAAQLGRALRSRVASQGVRPFEIDPVLAGVGRRRTRRRGGVIVVCVALVAGSIAALATRTEESVVGGDRVVPIDRPTMLPAYAILEGVAGFGEPTSMYALRGGSPMQVAVPQIDVWESGDQRLVIKTIDDSETPLSPAVTTTVVPVTAVATGPNEPWGGRAVERLPIRGVDGAIQELASDQFAIWIPTASAERYSVVIARGMSRSDALAAVSGMTSAGAVLQPSGSYGLVEHAPGLPASTESPAFAIASYGPAGGPSVATNSTLPGRLSIETVAWNGIGRLESINERQVLFEDNPMDGSTSATWLDPTGVLTSISTREGSVETFVPFVHIVDEARWIRLGAGLSSRLAGLPTVDDVPIGATNLIRKLDDHQAALCLQVDGTETCVADVSGDSPTSLVNQAEVNGHWIVFGYREILPEEESYLTADDVRFSSSNGSCCDVEATKHNGAFWFVVHIDDGVDVVDTNVGNVFGGVIGAISRPLVASNI